MTRKPEDTRWTEAPRERRLPTGDETRPSVDYMDYGEPGGGPTRRVVGGDGLLELPKEEGGGEGEGKERPTPGEGEA